MADDFCEKPSGYCSVETPNTQKTNNERRILDMHFDEGPDFIYAASIIVTLIAVNVLVKPSRVSLMFVCACLLSEKIQKFFMCCGFLFFLYLKHMGKGCQQYCLDSI